MFPLKDNIPTDRFPVVTVALIVINVLAYFFFQDAGITSGPDDQNVLEYGAIPYEITNPGQQCIEQAQRIACGELAWGSLPPTWQTIFTSMFMHGSLLHLGGNMLFLWIFGNNVEDSMGPVRYLAFYLLGGVAALAAQTLIGPSSPVPTIGASGAVSAVLGGYILMHPRARVLTVVFIIFFFTLIELPALVMLGLWFIQQAIFGYLDLVDPVASSGGVAYFAHIGGFVFGLLLIRVFATRRKDVPPRTPRRGYAWR